MTEQRVNSVDIGRGAIMILMALDHVRVFFSDAMFQPENMEQTNLALFLTRWVTHFCAPGFFFLAGVSAWLAGRRRPRAELSRFLLTRGLWLVALELTVVGFAWSFRPGFSFAGVIWALGWSMVILAGLIWLPIRVTLVTSVLIIASHHLLDRFAPPSEGLLDVLWRFLYVPWMASIAGHPFLILYPLIPWFAVMSLGYAIGPIYELTGERRRRLLAMLGGAAVLLFFVLRVTNIYGNPITGNAGVFSTQPTVAKTVIAFLNVEKYPPSLQFLLMTLGPLLIFLSLLDRYEGGGIVRTFGRVALFYYVAHLYLIHIVALILAMMTAQPWRWLIWDGPFPRHPPEYGYSLPVVYVIWFVVIAILALPCRWFERVKLSRRHWWLSYL